MERTDQIKKTPWHWVMYDWANSAFALSVITAFFPVFFEKYWRGDTDASVVTMQLGMGNTFAGLGIAILCPLLGALVGMTRQKKKVFMAFVLLGVIATFSLSLIGKSWWLMAMAAFILGRVGFSIANFFYDSILVDVVPPSEYDRVSSLGYGFGYLGSAILFSGQLLFFMFHEDLGVDRVQATQFMFLSVAFWWLIFSLPMFFQYKDTQKAYPQKKNLMVQGWNNLKQVSKEILSNKNIALFLLAFWCYNDGVHTFVFMAANFASSIGIPQKEMMLSLLMVQLVAFPSSILFGKLAYLYGTKRMILVTVGSYLGLTLVAPLNITTSLHFFLAATAIGLVQGGIQALSRSLFARIIPSEKSVEFFGFYNFIGKFSMILGPGIMGGLTYLFYRMGLGQDLAARLGAMALSMLFLFGFVFLLKVDDQPTQ